MNWKFTKNALIATGLFIHVSSFAGATLLTSSNSNTNNETLLSSTEQNERVRKSELEKRRGGLLNPPARPIVEDYDFNLFGDLLIWQATEQGLPVAIQNKASSFTPAGAENLQKSFVRHLNFDYNTGFRLGVDFDTSKDGWDVSLTWLRFNADADRSLNVEGDKELFATQLNPQLPLFLAASGFSAEPTMVFREAEARWRAYLNQLDLDLGREFFVSKFLTLRPHFGLRTSWIRQKFREEYNNGIAIGTAPAMPDSEKHEKNKWWGIGLEGGLDTVWMLGSGISLYANLAAAIEYGFQKVVTRTEVEGFTPDFENNKDSYRTSRPILDLQLGLRWDRCFNDESYNFGLHAGWEHHVYFSQNQFHNNESLNGFVQNQGDLAYQGWTIGAHLAF